MTSTGSGRRLFAEAVVVVLSILLAFAIDAGWDNRQARENERAVIRGIQSELEESSQVLAASRDATTQAYDDLQRFLSAPRSELLQMSPSVAVNKVFAPLTRQFGGAIPTGALDAATGSGELAVISDPALRAALARLGSSNDAMKGMVDLIGEMDARTVAILGEFEGIQRIFTMDEPQLDAETLAALRSDPRIMGAATAKMWFVGGYLSELGRLQSIIDENLRLIADNLED